MVKDTATVLRKELREILFPDGRLQGGAKNSLVIVALAGLLFPLQTGPRWFTSWLSVYSACFPVIMVVNYAADGFAGERERHTLETLLATRLDERAIVFGKILAVVLYGWALVLACQPVTVAALNIANRQNGFIFYRPAILLAIIVLGALVSLLLCSIGLFVSLTAPTVRAAGQRMLVPFLLIFALPGALPLLARRMHWERATANLTPGTVVTAVAIACLVLSAATIFLVLTRFTRERAVLA